MAERHTLENWQEHEYCYLTTVGRVTGKPHTIEIWFHCDESNVWLFTEPSGKADWVLNLRKQPSVKLRLGEREVDATAEVIALPQDAIERSKIAERYRKVEDGLEAWASSALVVRVTPQ